MDFQFFSFLQGHEGGGIDEVYLLALWWVGWVDGDGRDFCRGFVAVSQAVVGVEGKGSGGEVDGYIVSGEPRDTEYKWVVAQLSDKHW